VDGVAICTAADNQFNPKMAPDGQGGAYVVWEDYRNYPTTQVDVYAQHLDGGGGVSLAANGLALCALAGNQNEPSLAVDEGGNACFAWTDYRIGIADIFAQRVSNSGAVSWFTSGLQMCASGNSQTGPRVASASSDHFMIAWTDARTAPAHVYAQHVDQNGTALWTVNGIPIVSSGGPQNLVALVNDRTGYFVAIWQDQSSSLNMNLFAQKFDAAGITQWAVAGVPIRQASGFAYGTNLSASADGLGGILAAWWDARTDAGDIYAQRLSAAGLPLWKLNGVPLTTASGEQFLPAMCASPSGGAFVSWDDSGIPSGVSANAVDEWGYLGAAPVMNDVRDVPNDQGGQVKVSWLASPLDTDPLFRNITDYIVYRSVPPQLVAGLGRLSTAPLEEVVPVSGRRYRHTRFAATDYFWEELAHVTPHHLAGYSAVVPTEGDSVAGSNPLSVFMVEALANGGASYWFTRPDSAYSVDNLAPLAPAPFTGQYAGGEVHLHWDPNAEPDLAGYRLYRGTSASFVPGPASLVAALPDTGYGGAPGQPYYYKLSAVDSHGNESPFTALTPSGTLATPPEGPAIFFLAPPAPNPVRRGAESVLHFGLATAGRAELQVLDPAGRRVRVFVLGQLPAGGHRLAWDGTDDGGRAVRSGLYFVRLTAGGRAFNGRLVRIE
jgi:hypothetical protein